MNEKQLRSSLLLWYREALKGNPALLEAVSKAIETLHLFDMVSESIYDFSCYLIQNLYEINIMEYHGSILIPVDELKESEVFPFA